jgi:SAM-dependent methyltransferase
MRLPIEIPKATRNDLPLLFNALGFTKGVEIGTWKGEYAETLCKLAPSVDLTCVDPWKAYAGYFDFTGLEQVQYDNVYKRTAKRLSKYNARLLRKTSGEALADFADASLDFVYIDGNHELSYVVFDLVNWARKVKPGGIIAGHDYLRLTNNYGHTHVVEAVQAVADSYHIHPVFLLGLRAKEEGIPRDCQRSFFWINP